MKIEIKILLFLKSIIVQNITPSCVKWLTTSGVIKPAVVPAVFIMPYTVDAKLGARSCEFCKFVRVAAPFMPSESVINATQTYGQSLTYGIHTRNIPGIMCAKINRSINHLIRVNDNIFF